MGSIIIRTFAVVLLGSGLGGCDDADDPMDSRLGPVDGGLELRDSRVGSTPTDNGGAAPTASVGPTAMPSPTPNPTPGDGMNAGTPSEPSTNGGAPGMSNGGSSSMAGGVGPTVGGIIDPGPPVGGASMGVAGTPSGGVGTGMAGQAMPLGGANVGGRAATISTVVLVEARRNVGEVLA